jgi:methionyl-tRNA formyltransferase
MKKTLKPIVFFGNERLATGVETTAPTLTRLIESGYNVAAVVASNDVSTSRKQRQLEVSEVAKAYNIPVFLPKNLSEIRDTLLELNAEAAILVAYGKMIPQPFIDMFPRGIVNIHPSLLPLHRGPTPIESVILNGEEVTGVSLMRLAKEMDAGPIYAQEKIKLRGSESKQQLASTLLKLGGDMLLDTLPGILKGNIEPEPQNDSKATYDRLISKKDGVLDWKKPAQQLVREVRAYSHWPGSYTSLAGKDVIITKAHAQQNDSQNQNKPPGTIEISKAGDILVTSKDGVVVIDYLKPAGKKEMPATAFVAGHRQLLIPR